MIWFNGTGMPLLGSETIPVITIHLLFKRKIQDENHLRFFETVQQRI